MFIPIGDVKGQIIVVCCTNYASILKAYAYKRGSLSAELCENLVV